MNFDIISFLQCFSLALLETLFILAITYGLIKHCSCTFSLVLPKAFFFTFVKSIFTYIDSDHILFSILPLLAHIILIYSLTKETIMHSIYIAIISYICILVLQLIIIIAFRFTAINQDSYIVQVFANIATLILSILLAHFLPIYHIYNFMVRKDIAFRFFLGNTFVVVFFVQYLVVAHLSHFIYYFITIIIVVGLLVFVNVELLRSRVIVDKQKAIIDNYNKYLPIVDELIEQVRGRQHSYDNNIQSLSALAMTCNDYESLRSELLKNIDVMSHSDLPIFLLKFNLKLLSGLLFQKYSVAAKQGIHMDFTIKNYNIQSAVPEYIIVEAVGILMDNAIEASSENDTIYITIDCTQNKFHFHIMNVGPTFTSEFYKNIFTRGYTTKSSTGRNHGLGLNHLLEMSKKYNGRLGVGNEQRRGTEYLFFSIDL